MTIMLDGDRHAAASGRDRKNKFHGSTDDPAILAGPRCGDAQVGDLVKPSRVITRSSSQITTNFGTRTSVIWLRASTP